MPQAAPASPARATPIPSVIPVLVVSAPAAPERRDREDEYDAPRRRRRRRDEDDDDLDDDTRRRRRRACPECGCTDRPRQITKFGTTSIIMLVIGIFFWPPELAEQVRLAAQQSVACLSGDVAEALIRDLVAQVRHTQKAEAQMRQLLSDAFAGLPASPHVQVITIPGIGTATAAAIVGKAVDIHRFASPAHFVGYFGVFPEENSSGVDKDGEPLPLGSLHMSRKGNDLVRHYLWNAARSAIRHNPAIATLYHRLKDRGTRGDVALGHCMRKLLHLVFAVWKTNRPFDPKHCAEIPTGVKPSDSPLSPPPEAKPISTNEEAGGPQTGFARRKSGHHGQCYRSAADASCQARAARPASQD